MPETLQPVPPPIQPVTTFEENMALLAGQPIERSTGGQTSPPGAAASNAPTAFTQTTNGTSTAAPSSPPATRPQVSAPESGQIEIGGYSPKTDIYGTYAGLFQPVVFGVQKGAETLGGLAAQFGAETTPYRTYDTAGAERALRQAVETPGASLDVAKGLVQAEYKGPTTLAGLGDGRQADIDRLRASTAGLQAQGAALREGVGVQDLLGQYAPGITPGEALYESRRLRAEPGFREASRQAQTDIGQLYANLARAEGQAEAIGQRRTGEETDIAKRSQEFLRGQEEALLAPIRGRIGEAETRDAATAAAFQRFRETGDWRDLLGAPEGAATFDPSAFQTPAVSLFEEAVPFQKRIMDQYASIRDVPLMGLGANRHGREELVLDPDWLASQEGKYTPEQLAGITETARQRHKELAEAGFSPRAENYLKPGFSVQTPEAGRYSPVTSLYAGMGNWAPADLQLYVSASQAQHPDLENLSNAEEKRKFNTINEILGELDRMDPERQSFEAMSILGEVDRYLSEEEAGLKEFQGNRDEAFKQHAADVRHARKTYKKTQRKSQKFARAMKTVGWPGAEGQGALAGNILSGIE